ncbi:MAG: hypothetical protein K1X89_20135 [Myxococcaceae bacterium]|nr:hypothetical protein [Myxococcaceae bacterium]
MIRRAALALSFLAAACKPQQTPAQLLSEVHKALAARDAALSSYRFEGTATQGGQTLKYRFAFKTPNKSVGEITGPDAMRLKVAFDGHRLLRQDLNAKTHQVFELKLKPQDSMVFLNGAFAPFVFEGFRTPLLPIRGVTAAKVERDGGGEAVTLKASPGEGVEVTYLLSWPGADVLERRLGEVRLVTEAEHCDEAKKLCVPRVLRQVRGTEEEARTELSNIELGAALDDATFELTAPEGFTSTTQVLDALPAQ